MSARACERLRAGARPHTHTRVHTHACSLITPLATGARGGVLPSDVVAGLTAQHKHNVDMLLDCLRRVLEGQEFPPHMKWLQVCARTRACVCSRAPPAPSR